MIIYHSSSDGYLQTRDDDDYLQTRDDDDTDVEAKDAVSRLPTDIDTL